MPYNSIEYNIFEVIKDFENKNIQELVSLEEQFGKIAVDYQLADNIEKLISMGLNLLAVRFLLYSKNADLVYDYEDSSYSEQVTMASVCFMQAKESFQILIHQIIVEGYPKDPKEKTILLDSLKSFHKKYWISDEEYLESALRSGGRYVPPSSPNEFVRTEVTYNHAKEELFSSIQKTKSTTTLPKQNNAKVKTNSRNNQESEKDSSDLTNSSEPKKEKPFLKHILIMVAAIIFFNWVKDDEEDPTDIPNPPQKKLKDQPPNYSPYYKTDFQRTKQDREEDLYFVDIGSPMFGYIGLYFSHQYSCEEFQNPVFKGYPIPEGLILTEDGKLHGYPKTVGTFEIKLSAIDYDGNRVTQVSTSRIEIKRAENPFLSLPPKSESSSEISRNSMVDDPKTSQLKTLEEVPKLKGLKVDGKIDFEYSMLVLESNIPINDEIVGHFDLRDEENDILLARGEVLGIKDYRILIKNLLVFVPQKTLERANISIIPYSKK